MTLSSIRLKLTAVLFSVFVSACGGGGSSASPPASITVTPGNQSATVTWAADPGVEYWLLYNKGTSVSITGLTPSDGHRWVTKVTSPAVVTGLTNGTAYAFTLNGRTGGGPGGPGTPPQSVIPRPAGQTWTAGAVVGVVSPNLRGVAYGTASDATVNYVAVGDNAAVYKASDAINWTPLGTNLPAVNLKAAVYTLGQFIAVGSGAANNIYRSSDMSNWTAATTVVATGLNAVTGNSATVVAVGDAGKIWYSTNGADWTAATLPAGFSANLYGVAYASNGLWLAVGAGGAVLTSVDAVTWTSVTSSTVNTLRSVAVQVNTGYTYVAVGDGGVVVSSTNGTSWTGQSLGTANLYAVNASSDQILAVGAGGAAFTLSVSTTPDGVTPATGATLVWTSQANAAAASGRKDLFAVMGSSTQYFAIGQGGAVISSK